MKRTDERTNERTVFGRCTMISCLFIRPVFLSRSIGHALHFTVYYLIGRDTIDNRLLPHVVVNIQRLQQVTDFCRSLFKCKQSDAEAKLYRFYVGPFGFIFEHEILLATCIRYNFKLATAQKA